MGQLLLVRHGQASWDAEDYDVLSERGWEQARLLGRSLAQRGFRPDVVLRGCSLAVRDADGTRYDYVANGWGATQPASPCVPADAPGPAPSLGDLDDVLTPDSTPRRPATWTVSPVVVLPADVQVSDVVLWWQLPQHVVLPTARG